MNECIYSRCSRSSGCSRNFTIRMARGPWRIKPADSHLNDWIFSSVAQRKNALIIYRESILAETELIPADDLFLDAQNQYRFIPDAQSTVIFPPFEATNLHHRDEARTHSIYPHKKCQSSLSRVPLHTRPCLH